MFVKVYRKYIHIKSDFIEEDAEHMAVIAPTGDLINVNDICYISGDSIDGYHRIFVNHNTDNCDYIDEEDYQRLLKGK